MTTLLVHELRRLVQETRLLLDCADWAFEAWAKYGEQRAMIIARLGEMDFRVEGEEKQVVATLLQEILAQDAILLERAQARLTLLGAAIRTAATSRRAVKIYDPSLPPLLFERCV